jgi:hypothetical protein
MKSTKQGAFKFSVLFSGFFPLDTDIQALFQLPINTPSIHIWGVQDTDVIPGNFSSYEQILYINFDYREK